MARYYEEQQQDIELYEDADRDPREPPAEFWAALGTPEDDEGEEDDVEVIDYPLIPEGLYNLVYQEHGTVSTAGGGKLRIIFAVADGEYAGTELECHYPVAETRGPV